jgi:prolyl 4-hydroxylase
MNNVIITKHKSGDFELYEIEDILTHHECDELIRVSKQIGLSTSNVLNPVGEELDKSYRTSEQLWLPNNYNDIIKKISDYNQTLTKLPYENQEDIQIVHYNQGGLFKLHTDACAYDKITCDKTANRNNSGQRKSTLLLYLNDNYEHGETEFPSINKKIIPKKGKGIFFYSTDDDENILLESYHVGNQVINGEKWIATIWTHVNKFS